MPGYGKEAVVGLKQARAAFRNINPAFSARYLVATEATAQEVEKRAKANVPVRTGALKDHIGYTVSKATGVAAVGIRRGVVLHSGEIVNAFSKRLGRAFRRSGMVGEEPSRIAHLVEFGTVHSAAQPFMYPALEAERGPYLTRVREASKLAERDLVAAAAPAASAGGTGML